MKLQYTYFILTIFFTVSFQAQQLDSLSQKKKYTPYELLSSYYNSEFKPFKKGTKYAGMSMSLEDRSMENTENIFEKIIDGNRINFNVLLKSGYYFNDYSMLGLNIAVSENKFEGLLFKDSDTINSKSITRGYSITPNYRNTIPLTANERLSFFTAVGVTLGKSNTLKRDIKNTDEIEKSFSENYNLRVGISPGVTFFAMEKFALEIQVDVAGYEMNVINKTKNDVDKSRDVRHNVDFKLNLLSLKFGIAYNL